jgi:lipocalin
MRNFRKVIVIGLLNLIACSSTRELPTVKQLDLQQYAGTWYEIARLPNRFEKGLICVSATYSIKPDGQIRVRNKGHKTDNLADTKEIEGRAWVPNSAKPGQLKVEFFWPFAGNYYVISLDSEYRLALVGDPSRKYLWVLSKTPSLPDSQLQAELKKAQALGFDINKVEIVPQDCQN